MNSTRIVSIIKSFYYWIVCGIISLLPFVWIPWGYMINSEDGGFMNYEILMNKSPLLWTDTHSSGLQASPITNSLIIPNAIFYYFCKNIFGLPNHFTQKIFISFTIILIFFSWYLVQRLINVKSKKISLIPVIFYLCNFYVANSFTYTAKMFQLILLPLLFYLTLSYLITKKVKFLAIHFLVLFIFQGIFTNVPQLIATILIYPITFLYYLITNNQPFFSKSLIKFSLFIGVTIPIYYYQLLIWFLSFYDNIKEITTTVTFSSIQSNLSKILQIRGSWWENTGFEGIPYSSLEWFYNNPYVIISRFTIIIILIVYIVFNHKNNKKNIFWLSIFLIFTTVASGLKPFQTAYQLMYEHTFLIRIFREPWAKFMPLVIFSIAMMIINIQKKKILFSKDKIVLTILYYAIILQGFPFFSSNFYQKNISWKQAFIKPPQYWWEYSKWTSSIIGSTILPLPYVNYQLDWIYNWYPNEKIGNTNVNMSYLFNSTRTINKAPFYKPSDIVDNSIKEKNLDFICKIKVDYVLIQSDLIRNDGDLKNYKWEYERVKDYIKTDPLKDFGNTLFVYELKDKFKIPQVYRISTEQLKNKNVCDQQKLPVEYKRINSTNYSITINNLKGDTNIIFSDKYSKFWILEKNTSILKKLSKLITNMSPWNQNNAIEENHFIANGYSNGWKIDPISACSENDCEINNDGSYNVKYNIVYSPQYYFYYYYILICFITITSLVIIFYSKIFGQANNEK